MFCCCQHMLMWGGIEGGSGHINWSVNFLHQSFEIEISSSVIGPPLWWSLLRCCVSDLECNLLAINLSTLGTWKLWSFGALENRVFYVIFSRQSELLLFLCVNLWLSDWKSWQKKTKFFLVRSTLKIKKKVEWKVLKTKSLTLYNIHNTSKLITPTKKKSIINCSFQNIASSNAHPEKPGGV